MTTYGIKRGVVRGKSQISLMLILIGVPFCGHSDPVHPKLHRNSQFLEMICHTRGFYCNDLTEKKALTQPLGKRSAQTNFLGQADSMFNLADSSKWNAPFNPRGLLGIPFMITPIGDSVFVSGMISRADGVPVMGVALWDGRQWKSVGYKPPFNTPGFVDHLIHDGKIYLGGDIYNKASIVTWDGSSWESRPPDISYGTPIGVWQEKVLIGVNHNGIWSWDVDGFSQFGPDLSGIGKLLSYKEKLWLVGTFQVKDDLTVRNFAVWENGTWNTSEAEATGPIAEWALFGNEIFVLGERNSTKKSFRFDSLSVMCLKGSTWESVSIDADVGHPIKLAADKDKLFLISAKRFLFMNAAIPRWQWGLQISKWNGSRFVLVENIDFEGSITDAKMSRNGLILAGLFSKIGSLEVDNLAGWDENKWFPFTQEKSLGIHEDIQTMISNEGNLIFGGYSESRGLLKGGIVAWDGSSWNNFGGGLRKTTTLDSFGNILGLPAADVNALVVQNGHIYAGGRFDSAGGKEASNIARWDGKEWHALQNGYPGKISSMVVHDGNLYVSGQLDSIRYPTSHLLGSRVAVWNGASWKNLKDFGTPGGERKLVQFKGNLWACEGNQLFNWNGLDWYARELGDVRFSGANLLVHKEILHIAVRSIYGSSILTFDGEDLGSLPYVNSTLSLASDGNFLYASGEFDIPGEPGTTLAKWDGRAWHPMAGGKQGLKPHVMVAHGGHLYIGLNLRYYVHSPYGGLLRFQLGQGTWSSPMVKGNYGKDKLSWKIMPCISDCFLPESGALGRSFDLIGRSPGKGSHSKAQAAGIRIDAVPR